MHRTAQFIEETKAQASETRQPDKKRGKGARLRNGLSPEIGKATQIKPGEIRNPGGRPKRDIAADIARAVFETSEPEAIAAFRAALLKGNAYTFKELAERAFGKLQEKKEVTHVYQEVPDADLSKRIADLERDLGYARAIDEAGRIGIAQAGTGAADRKPEDSPVLS